MSRLRRITNRLARISLEGAKIMAISGVALALLLANPFVQSYLARKATNWLRNHKNIHVHIDKLQIIFPNQLGLKNTVLFDDQGDTIIYFNQLRASVAHISDGFSNIALSKVYLDSTHYYLLTPHGDSINGFMRFLGKLSSDTETDAPSDFRLRIQDIQFEKLKFKRIDVNNPDLPAFKVHNAHLRIRNFSLTPDSISAHLSKAYGTDDQFFTIHHLEARLTYSGDHIGVYALVAQTDSSYLNMDAALRYRSIADFEDFENTVNIQIQFRNTEVNTGEVRTLLPDYPSIPNVLINGNFSGVLNNFSVFAAPLSVGKHTTYDGSLTISRLIDTPSNPLLNIRIGNFKTRMDEAVQIIKILANSEMPEMLEKELHLSANGTFQGTPNQFTTAIQAVFDKGEELTFNMAMENVKNQPSYSGDIALKDVHVGRILGVESLGKATASLSVTGTGLEPENIQLLAKGNIQKIYFNKYNYQNISLSEFTFKNNNYFGVIFIKDPHISANSTIRYIEKENSTFTEFSFNLNNANPLVLNWTADSITKLSFSSSGIVDLKQSENPVANIVVKEIFAENTLGYYHFESIKILSQNTENENQFELKSDFASAKIRGKYNLFDIPDYLTDWMQKRIGKIPHDTHPHAKNAFNLRLQAENVDALFDLLYIRDLKIEPNTLLTATYEGDQSSLSLQLNSQGISYGSFHSGMLKTRWDHTSPVAAEGFVNMYHFRYDDLTIDSIQFHLVNTPDSNAFELLWNWIDSIGSTGHIDGWLVKNTNNDYRLHFDRSEFNIGREKFVINPANYFDFEKERIYVSNFQIINGPRSLLANGVISENAYEILRINLDNFRIDLFNIFLKPFNSKLDGIMQGEIIVNNLLNEPKFASDFEIDSLHINGLYQGNFYFISDWDVETKMMNIRSNIQRGQLKTLEIYGYLTTKGTLDFDFSLKTNRFRVNALSPVLGEFVQNLRGTVNGDIAVKGQPKNLDIAGKLTFPNLGLTIPLLGTDYNFEGAPSVTINNREIAISEMIIRDTKTSSRATLNGRITHRDFSDFRFNIGIDAERFLALNTNATSGDLYYGTAFVTGKIAITGPTDEPVIDVNVRTERGTLFALPLNNPTEVGRLSFINFVQKTDNTTQERTSLNLGGLTLRFNIDVTPEAEAQLILDDRYNDMMRANGQGRIALTVPPSGNISLVGNYQITKGVYNFNFQGLVSRKFLIEPGSTITFTGDPLAANLDITTRYSTRTTLRGLLTDERFLNTRTQVDLLLKITGVMFQPEISFDIKVPRAAPMVQTEINNALADRDKLTRQAFSLLLLNSFMTDDFGVGTTSPGATLVYDAFVSQISNLLAQRIKGVDIRLGYSQTNLQGQEGAINQQQDLELGISTTLFNDRFVINTNFDISTQQNTQNARRNDLAGDVELEYLITPDGKFRAKAFNRSLQNRIGLEQVGDYAQGLGLTYRTNFDSWYHDILRVRRKTKTEDFKFEEPDTSADSPSTYYPKNPTEWKPSSMRY